MCGEEKRETPTTNKLNIAAVNALKDRK